MAGCHLKPEQLFSLLFGYSEEWLENDFVTGAATPGDVYLTAVPAGEIWVVTHAMCRHTDPAARTIAAGIYDGANPSYFFQGVGVAAQVYVESPVWWVLPAGYQVTATANTLAAARRLYVYVTGFKQIISQ